MNHYKFETSHFGISEEGLHLLRNKFNYQTLSFQDIHSAAIKRGVESKNWLALLITGLVLLGLCAYCSYSTYQEFTDPKTTIIYIESIVLPVLPLLLGIYCVYISLKKVHIIDVMHDKGTERLGLSELNKQERVGDFVNFLQNKLKSRLSVDNSI